MVWTGRLPVIWLLQFIHTPSAENVSSTKCIKSAKISLYYGIAFLEKLSMTQEEKYMKAAIREAKDIYALEEVPIGCVIVRNGWDHCAGLQQKKYRGGHAGARGLTAIKRRAKDRRLAAGRLHDGSLTSEPCRCAGGHCAGPRMKGRGRQHGRGRSAPGRGIKSAPDAAV